ncbi:Fascin-like protein [Pandoravirus macleodensis]|uniref:Fascin-like protein n=1 Tax=Pandoravirus macleodensis TaxID=2107707 RepID=A0A2U7UHH2_9VIRU|nr:Fascin-like protein [Pandoravirus macleodensis]AVK77411.1 Fascin-like protein [Pandoravirus macleodensis]UMO80192.1 Fascin-like protein [Pandoravirus aubagnensis]
MSTMRTLGMLVALLCCISTTAHGHRYSVLLGASQSWSLPANATDVVVSLWGGGGGASSTGFCTAGGGSGSAVMYRAAGEAAWAVPIEQVQWAITVGGGGWGRNTPSTGGTAGNGGNTLVVATAPNGTELFRAAAYGGGGGYSLISTSRRGCQGGAGGGATSAAIGIRAGGGNPSGAVDDNLLAAPKEGAIVGDIKAGGAGAGGGYAYNTLSMPFTVGAGWTSPGRQWAGGQGQLAIPCYGSGGAAGFNGNGGDSQTAMPKAPPANSGSGGGSAYLCYPTRLYSDSDGAAGGVLVEYTHPVSPVVALKSSVSGKYLTAHSYSGVSASAASVQAWERWTAIRLDNGKYVFRSWQNKYLRANPTDSVDAGATAASTWEQFEAIDKGADRWSLKNHYGKYVVAAADGFVYSDVNADHVWQVVFL